MFVQYDIYLYTQHPTCLQNLNSRDISLACTVGYISIYSTSYLSSESQQPRDITSLYSMIYIYILNILPVFKSSRAERYHFLVQYDIYLYIQHPTCLQIFNSREISIPCTVWHISIYSTSYLSSNPQKQRDITSLYIMTYIYILNILPVFKSSRAERYHFLVQYDIYLYTQHPTCLQNLKSREISLPCIVWHISIYSTSYLSSNPQEQRDITSLYSMTYIYILNILPVFKSSRAERYHFLVQYDIYLYTQHPTCLQILKSREISLACTVWYISIYLTSYLSSEPQQQRDITCLYSRIYIHILNILPVFRASREERCHFLVQYDIYL